MGSEKITMLQRANAWSQLVIGAAIEVHRIKGPGLLEEIYNKFLGRECENSQYSICEGTSRASGV
jgi:PD-(D/E)XK nuclease superfamily